MKTLRFERPDTRKLVTLRLPDKLYADFLKGFTVAGAAMGGYVGALCTDALARQRATPFNPDEHDVMCAHCRLGRVTGTRRADDCPKTVPGLSVARTARLYIRNGWYLDTNVRILRNFRRRIRRMVVQPV